MNSAQDQKIASSGSKKDNRITFSQTFLSGGISGVASRTITSPLDVVKILFQVGTKETQTGFVDAFRRLYANEGMKAFFKGNVIACVRLFPYNAVQFVTYNSLKNNSQVDQILGHGPFAALVSGSIAGVAATVSTYPTDMVKTRLTVTHTDKSKAKYKGTIDAFRVIYREEGFRAYYKGMSTSIIGVIPYAGGQFMAYEILDKAWGKPKEKMTPLENFLNGCVAAAFAQTFSFPFDTIRKKLQAQSQTVTADMKPDVQFNGLIDAFRQTVKQKGFFALWAGTTANLVKVVPYAGIMFATFEASKRAFLYTNGFTTSPLVDQPIPGIPQDLTPAQLKEWKQKQSKNNA